eukprot:COSAG06_NODE_70917_length_189_cov_28.733333_1_plen_31_part_10
MENKIDGSSRRGSHPFPLGLVGLLPLPPLLL